MACLCWWFGDIVCRGLWWLLADDCVSCVGLWCSLWRRYGVSLWLVYVVGGCSPVVLGLVFGVVDVVLFVIV